MAFTWGGWRIRQSASSQKQALANFARSHEDCLLSKGDWRSMSRLIAAVQRTLGRREQFPLSLPHLSSQKALMFLVVDWFCVPWQHWVNSAVGFSPRELLGVGLPFQISIHFWGFDPPVSPLQHVQLRGLSLCFGRRVSMFWKPTFWKGTIGTRKNTTWWYSVNGDRLIGWQCYAFYHERFRYTFRWSHFLFGAMIQPTVTFLQDERDVLKVSSQCSLPFPGKHHSLQADTQMQSSWYFCRKAFHKWKQNEKQVLSSSFPLIFQNFFTSMYSRSLYDEIWTYSQTYA